MCEGLAAGEKGLMIGVSTGEKEMDSKRGGGKVAEDGW